MVSSASSIFAPVVSFFARGFSEKKTHVKDIIRGTMRNLPKPNEGRLEVVRLFLRIAECSYCRRCSALRPTSLACSPEDEAAVFSSGAACLEDRRASFSPVTTSGALAGGVERCLRSSKQHPYLYGIGSSLISQS